MEIVSYPAVYDTAFQFRNTRKVVDFIEWCIKRYADLPVRSILDIACGTGHYTRELARRGYIMYGIDINPAICQYAQQRAQAESLNMTISCDDMVDFVLPVRCDLGVSFFDSLTYIPDVDSLVRHFRTVSRVLSPGGLYIVEVGVIDDFNNHNVEEVWTEVRRDFAVTTTYFRDGWINHGMFQEECSFCAICREHVAFFRIRFLKLALDLTDFDRIVRRSKVFTPLAYYEDFDSGAILDHTILPWRVIAVLKRKEEDKKLRS